MELTEQKHLQALIDNNIPEDTNLEYKDPDSLISNLKNSDIAGDISAMANSDGGIIIYGICEDERKMPATIKWIEDRALKEKIQQIIQSRIVPQINGIVFREIPSVKDNTQFVLVLDIPKSYDTPHQAHLDNNKRRYLGRNGSITRELEHYEVENLFNRRRGPKLKVALSDKVPGRRYTLNGPYTIDVINEGNQLGEKIMIKMIIPNELEVSGDNWHIISSGPYKTMTYFEDKLPCYPEVPNIIGNLYCPKQETIIEEVSIGLYIVCKDMNLKKYILKINRGALSTELFEGEGIPLPKFSGYVRPRSFS